MADPTAWEATRRHWRGRLQNVPAASVGLPRARWHNAQRVLQAVLWFDQKGAGCWAGSAALAEEADLSRSTLGRAKRDAVDLGLLQVERRDSPAPDGGRLTDLLRVDLARLAELVGDEPLDPPSATPDSQPAGVASDRRPSPEGNAYPLPTDDSRRRLAVARCGDGVGGAVGDTVGGAVGGAGRGARGVAAPPSAQLGDAVVQGGDASTHTERYIKEETPNRITTIQPPPTQGQPPPAEPPAAPPHDAWRVVEGELFQTGVNQAAAACREARAAGLTPAEAHALVDHWRPRQAAWGEHACAVLRRRLQRATPGQPADEGWPAYADGAPQADAVRADRRADELRRERRRQLLERAERLIAPLTGEQRARLGAEARRWRPELAKRDTPGRRVFEEGVAPLVTEWGEAGLERWLSEAA